MPLSDFRALPVIEQAEMMATIAALDKMEAYEHQLLEEELERKSPKSKRRGSSRYG